MIRHFRHRGLKRLYERDDASKINPTLAGKIARILSTLDGATSIDGMKMPGWDLHPLTGDLKGFWAVKVSANWRIVFRFENGEALDVDLVDYH